MLRLTYHTSQAMPNQVQRRGVANRNHCDGKRRGGGVDRAGPEEDDQLLEAVIVVIFV